MYYIIHYICIIIIIIIFITIIIIILGAHYTDLKTLEHSNAMRNMIRGQQSTDVKTKARTSIIG